MDMNQLLKNFYSPPPGYGEVAFFWWHGDRITKEKLSWILDQLKDAHLSGLQINYCHGDAGGLQWGLTMHSDPEPFSEAWWELVGWFRRECEKYGIALSLSDYTLGAPGQGFFVDEVLKKNPRFSGQLVKYADGEVSIATIPNSLNPMEKGVGAAVADTFYGEFERRFPGCCGKSINFFFSDELNFNVRGKLWCSDFAEEFIARKGYDIRPKLKALFEDIGAQTPKIRLDYYDVIVQLSEENYFEPVFTWHESRGMTFGCDHGGRGKDITEFGDYFRTMKWNSAPGNDQPHLESDIIKTKVSASICHLYNRRRTWLEGFYSSGWGTSSAQVMDAVYRNFALGHNLLSLHGLYYSTHGSMWEWAPPCNHFHMPYWQQMPFLLAATERLSWLLSQGHHSCDVAVVYPVAALEADEESGAAAVKTAFSAGTQLYENGCDFDFIDFESIQRAIVDPIKKELCVANAKYKAVVLPDMQAVRFKMLDKLVDFAQAGGIVVLLGRLPAASDRVGRQDAQLQVLTEVLKKQGVAATVQQLPHCIYRHFSPDFTYTSCSEKPFIQHRKLDDADLYMVYGLPKNNNCFFRTRGYPVLLNTMTGKLNGAVPYTRQGEGTRVQLPAEGCNLLLFVAQPPDQPFIEKSPTQVLRAEGVWECELCPTQDNRFGDYRLPAFNGKLGPEVRSAKYCCTEKDCSALDLDDSQWEKADFGFGPQLWIASDQTAGLSQNDCIAMRFPLQGFKPCCFSWRTGMRYDAGNQRSYHGLKGLVTDDFLGLGQPEVLRLGSDVGYTGEGGWYVFGIVCSKKEQAAKLSFGEMKPDRIWLNHLLVEKNAVLLNRGKNLLLAHFGRCGRTHIIVHTEDTFYQRIPLAMHWYQNPAVLPFDAYPTQKGKPCWFRFVSPPGMKCMQLQAGGVVRAFCNGIPMQRTAQGFVPKYFTRAPAQIAVCVYQTCGHYAGAAISEPITFTCGTGEITVGDWSNIDAMRCYSGGLLYRKSFVIENTSAPVFLDLGKVVSAAQVYVNGKSAAVLVAPPFTVDISQFVKIGKNCIEVVVNNTLANHMSTIPTIYQGSLVSGLLGHSE